MSNFTTFFHEYEKDDGDIRWKAPELLEQGYKYGPLGALSGVWSFGMVVYVCMFMSLH